MLVRHSLFFQILVRYCDSRSDSIQVSRSVHPMGKDGIELGFKSFIFSSAEHPQFQQNWKLIGAALFQHTSENQA